MAPHSWRLRVAGVLAATVLLLAPATAAAIDWPDWLKPETWSNKLTETVRTAVEGGMSGVIDRWAVGQAETLSSDSAGLIVANLATPSFTRPELRWVHDLRGYTSLAAVVLLLIAAMYLGWQITSGRVAGRDVWRRLSLLGLSALATFLHWWALEFLIRGQNWLWTAPVNQMLAEHGPSPNPGAIPAVLVSVFGPSGVAGMQTMVGLLLTCWAAVMIWVLSLVGLFRLFVLLALPILSPVYIALWAWAESEEVMWGLVSITLLTVGFQSLFDTGWLVLSWFWTGKGLAFCSMIGVNPGFVTATLSTALVWLAWRGWFRPVTHQLLHPLTLNGGAVRSWAGGVLQRVGSVVTIAGTVTGQPELVAAGAGIKGFGRNVRESGLGRTQDYIKQLDVEPHEPSPSRQVRVEEVLVPEAEGRQAAIWAPAGVGAQLAERLAAEQITHVRQANGTYRVPLAARERAGAIAQELTDAYSPVLASRISAADIPLPSQYSIVQLPAGAAKAAAVKLTEAGIRFKRLPEGKVRVDAAAREQALSLVQQVAEAKGPAAAAQVTAQDVPAQPRQAVIEVPAEIAGTVAEDLQAAGIRYRRDGTRFEVPVAAKDQTLQVARDAAGKAAQVHLGDALASGRYADVEVPPGVAAEYDRTLTEAGVEHEHRSDGRFRVPLAAKEKAAAIARQMLHNRYPCYRKGDQWWTIHQGVPVLVGRSLPPGGYDAGPWTGDW